MPTAFIDLATALLIVGGWFALALAGGVLVGRAIHGANPTFEDEHPGRERVGITSISEYVAEQERKANRAKLAQRKRWGDAA